MKFGLQLPNKGPRATRELILECARIADGMAIDDLWVFDHLAIPPDQSEGSDGVYVEPLATLAFVAGVTERIGIGARVLILPYRPAFLTAKWVASIQELSGGRLKLGVGVGWMEAEFRVLGVDRSRRGTLTDESLALLHDCFAGDEVEINGERILFRPRPERPLIYVGGNPPHALERAVRYGEGWMAPGGDPRALAEPIRELHGLARAAGKAEPDVVASAALPIDDLARARDLVAELAGIGVTEIAVKLPYASAKDFQRLAERVQGLR